MSSKVPNGFHQAIVSTTVFLAGIALGYLKFFVVDESSREWSLFAALSAFGVIVALVMQAETLRRALQFENDDPANFAATANLLIGSVWVLIASGVCLVVAHWWQPWPFLTRWMNA